MIDLQDVRFALRRSRKQPGFTLVAVLTLALGLGGNTAVFTLVHALILRSLPVQRPAELYRLGDTNDCCVNSGLATSYSLFSFRLFEHLKASAPEFSEIAAFQANTSPFAVRRRGEAVSRSLPGAFVTANYFVMFGVRPAAGRMLRPSDDDPGASPVAVLSHRTWIQQFGGDPSVVGGAFFVNGRAMSVVGVAAEPFFGDTIRPDPAALWIPIGQEPALRGATSLLDRPDQNWLYAIGRLSPGASLERVGARVTTALQQWLSAQPFVGDAERPLLPRQHVVVAPAGGGVGLARQQYSRSLTLLFVASAMVLLIAMANLANLLLARADRGEAAVRAALGAPAGRLIRQALTEGILLALAGGLIGVGVAVLSTRALIKVVFPLVSFVPVDGTPSLAVWVFALALSVVTGTLFSAGPAWALSRTPPLGALSGAGRSLQTRSFVPRGSLLIVQVALSLVLLSTAGLLARSLGKLEGQRLGFTAEGRLVVRLDPPTAMAGDTVRLSALFARLEEELRRVPGVERVAYAMYSPMEGNNWSSAISIADRRSDPARPDGSSWNRVSPGYFETVGTRVLRGRPIDERDTPGGRRVAVVSESFARRFFEHADPIGQTVGIGDTAHAGDFQIVGVVEDVKYTGATQPEVRPMLFLPSFQTVEYADATARGVQARSTLPRAVVLQVAPAAQGIERGVRRAIAGADANLSVVRIITLASQVSANFRLERLMAQLTSVYGLLALALASLGLYGVTAYGVSLRTREIGVRMALGADRAGVVRTCVRGPLVHTCVGLAIGVAGALLVGRAVRAQLYGVEGIDPAVLVGAVAVMVLSAAVAAALPARRAASLNPATALRGE
jgi:predicted permease